MCQNREKCFALECLGIVSSVCEEIWPGTDKKEKMVWKSGLTWFMAANENWHSQIKLHAELFDKMWCW